MGSYTMGQGIRRGKVKGGEVGRGKKETIKRAARQNGPASLFFSTAGWY